MSLAALRPYIDAGLAELPMLTVHVTEACDSRCAGCSYGAVGGHALTREAAERLAADADALNVKIVLFTGGEPLTVPHLAELVKPFSGPGRHLYLATSGTRLAENAMVVLALFDEVFVSLDGGTPELHDSIRGVPTFEKLALGVAALKRWRALPVTARCTVQRANAPHLRGVLSAAKAMGLDRVSFLPVDTWSQAFSRPAPPDLIHLLPEEYQLDAIEAQLPALVEEFGTSFGTTFGAELTKNLGWVVAHLRGEIGIAEHPAKRCNTPLVSAVVEVNGEVRPCFFKAPIGAIDAGVAGGLRQVLHSDGARRMRARFDPRTDEDCKRCVCPKYFPLRDLIRGRLR